MSILWTIIIGFVAGVIAKFIMPGENEPSGFILTSILGIVGAFVATFLGQALGWYQPLRRRGSDWSGGGSNHRARHLWYGRGTQAGNLSLTGETVALFKATPDMKLFAMAASVVRY